MHRLVRDLPLYLSHLVGRCIFDHDIVLVSFGMAHVYCSSRNLFFA